MLGEQLFGLASRSYGRYRVGSVKYGRSMREQMVRSL